MCLLLILGKMINKPQMAACHVLYSAYRIQTLIASYPSKGTLLWETKMVLYCTLVSP